MAGAFKASKTHGYLTHDTININDSIRAYLLTADAKIGTPVTRVADVGGQPTVAPITTEGVVSDLPFGFTLKNGIFVDGKSNDTVSVLTHRGTMFYNVKGAISVGGAVQLNLDGGVWKVEAHEDPNAAVGRALGTAVDGETVEVEFFYYGADAA